MSSKKRRYSGLFRKYFVITISIILASFVFIGGALLLLVSKLWMDEKLELLSENTVNVADNARDVLQSDYLGQSGRASVILICNTLLQTSNAVNADIFITGLDGHVAYCKDVLQSDMALYTGNCIVHNKYQIPDDILKSVLSGQKCSTAGNMNVMTAEAHPFPTTLTYSHVIPGMWYTVSATNAAALCQRWFRDLFCDGEKLEAEKEGINAFEILDRKAAESPLGANGVLFHPYLQGERSPYWDPDLRASFTGVAISSTKGDLSRALLEGVAFSLLDCYGLIREMKLPVKRIFLIGGGAKSRLWSEIVCNVFNLPVRVPIPGDASYGSALLAGTGIGVFSSSAEAVLRCLKIDREIHPDPAQAEEYAKLFRRYKAVHDALAPIYAMK